MSDSDELARRALRQGFLRPEELVTAPSAPGPASIGGYRILGEIGRGGLGVVYRARSPEGREVALKVLARRDPETVARFAREARLQGTLDEGDGFVPLLASGVDGTVPFLVLPFVPGGTLARRLERGPLGIPETLALGRALARAVGRAHARGIVHRDLKPANVLFSLQGQPLVADLGLAKHFRADAPGASQSVHLSRTGEARGTLGYMPPEQIESAKEVPPTADVHALGAILHECLSGGSRAPGFLPPELALRRGSAFAPIRSLCPSVPEPLARAIDRALEPDPARRFPDAAAFARALDEAALDEGGGPAPPRRRRLALGVALVAAAVALAVLSRIRSGPGSAEGWKSSEPAASPASSPAAPSARLLQARRQQELGHALLKKGDRGGALDAFTRAIEMSDTFAVVRLERGRLRLGARDFAGAEEDAGRAAELDPGLAAARVLRAEARLRTKTPEAALEDARASVSLDPRLVTAHVAVAECCRRLGRADESVAAASSALALEPSCAAALAIMLGVRRPEALRAGLGLVGELARPDAHGSAPPEPRDRPEDPLLWVERSVALAGLRDGQSALAAASQAVELDPAVAEAWVARASARLQLGAFSPAVADATRALELDHTVTGAHVVRASALVRRGDPGDLALARPDLEAAGGGIVVDSLRRELGRFTSARSEQHLAKGELSAALADAIGSLDLTPEDTNRAVLSARLRLYAGDVPGARNDLARAADSPPSDSGARDAAAALGSALEIEASRTAGDLAAAEQTFERTYRLFQPSEGSIVWAFGSRVAHDRGDEALAIKRATVAVDVVPANAAGHLARGLARAAAGDPAGARRDLERALELAPAGALAVEARARIRELEGR